MAERSSPTPERDPDPVVLVVSDDPDVRNELEYGWPAGVKVVTAVDSREAMILLRDVVPSVVVADLQSGSAGGYGLARDMQAIARLARVPILMLLERAQDDWLAGQAGAQAWRVKPVETSELVDASLALRRRSA